MEKILNIWKQRNLTLFGKNLLINSLSTSLFIFNAQIDSPPVDFIKLVERLHKDFLWGGTAKIAHHTLIANYKSGGIIYKDLNSFLAAINVKFIQNLSHNSCSGHLALPNLWIKTLFKIPTSINEDAYFHDYFTNTLNVLNCMIKIPRKVNYNGHPFYYNILKTYENISQHFCIKIENIVSTPIWFNKILNTKFDPEISQAGFDFVKDLLPNNQPLIDNYNNLRNVKIRKLRNILNKIPQVWLDKVVQSDNTFITVIPFPTVELNNQIVYLNKVASDQIYESLIASKIRPPTGLLRWREDIDLTDAEITTAFTFARLCSRSTFDHAFQYKIVTNILPTNKYLARYQVRDCNLCSKCLAVPDTVTHRMWSCPLLVPYVEEIINFLKNDCNVTEDISFVQYLFGFGNNEGLNHILLELKKELFYNWDANVGVGTFCERFQVKVRKLMIKEKQIILSNNKFEKYLNKWEQFMPIYDFLGPDCQIFS